MHLNLTPEPHMHYTRARLDHNKRPIAENVKGLDGKPMRVARDLFSGHYYVQVHHGHLSSEDTPQAKSLREAVLKQKPLHFSSEKPGMTGYWVKVDHAQIPLSDADRKIADATLGSGDSESTAAPEDVPDYSAFDLPGVSADAPLQEIKESPKV